MTVALSVAAMVGAVLVTARAALNAQRHDRARRRVAQSGANPTPSRLPDAPRWLRDAIDDAALPFDPRVTAAAWSVTAIAVPVSAVAVAGPGLAVASGAAVIVGPWMVLRPRRGAKAARLEAALPLALESMGRTLRTGGSLRQAVAEAATDAPASLKADLETVSHAVGSGASLLDALDRWVADRPLPTVRLAAAALALGAETGGAQARALDGVAATIRDRLGAIAEMRAQATQARVSGGVIALSPLAFGVLSTATDHRTATFLFRTTPGLVLLVAGLALDAAGAAWMARLTRIGP